MRRSIPAITRFPMLKTERPRACLRATVLLTSRAATIGLLSIITLQPCHLPQDSRLAGYPWLLSVHDGLFGFHGDTLDGVMRKFSPPAPTPPIFQAMKGSTSLERIDAVLGRLLDALSDPKRRGRTVVI